MPDSEKSDRSAPVAAVNTLDALIRSLGGGDISSIPYEPLDLEAMHREEARLAAAEIARNRTIGTENRDNFFAENGLGKYPTRFSEITVDRCNQEAVDQARVFSASPRPGDRAGLFLLQGPAGSGKTTLVCCMLGYWLDHQITRIEYTSYDVLKVNFYFNFSDTPEERKARARLMERFMGASILVIENVNDDLTPTEQHGFSELLRTRASLDLPVVLTSAISFENLHHALGDSCFEALRDFAVIATALTGHSRRREILYHGNPVL